MFNTVSTVFNNYMIHRTPIHWQLPAHNPSGGTDWNLAIQFLTARLSIGDNICYTMVTDIQPEYIYINTTVANNFSDAYKKYVQKGCYFYFRILDVRGLPIALSLKTAAL